MSPSRGFSLSQCSFRSPIEAHRKILLAPRAFSSFSLSPAYRLQPWPSVRLHASMYLACRGISTFSQRLVDPTRKVQSYISASSDPYLNLSIEDYILRTSPPESVVLFLYTNRPSIIIGRNQNPWSEVALYMLKAPELPESEKTTVQYPASFKRHNEQLDNSGWAPVKGIGRDVDLVRRRSGGGTVFHDEGNMNWSITMPMLDFTRDKNAEMVVRALRKMGIDRARVNERHDIVLDQGQKDERRKKVDPNDTHLTDYMITLDDLPNPTIHAPPPPLKVSGSAYKLTRGRALHHATTLLSSPNIHLISSYLKSPAASWIQAKGVESVSSPIANIGLEVAVFQKCLQEEFAATYGKDPIVETVGHEHLQIPEIRKGYDELQSKDWLWSQTPQFTLILRPLPEVEVQMNVHHGVITGFDIISTKRTDTKSTSEAPADKHKTIQTKLEKVGSVLVGRKLQDIHSWRDLLTKHIKPFDLDTIMVADLLDKLMPVPDFRKAGKNPGGA